MLMNPKDIFNQFLNSCIYKKWLEQIGLIITYLNLVIGSTSYLGILFCLSTLDTVKNSKDWVAYKTNYYQT